MAAKSSSALKDHNSLKLKRIEEKKKREAFGISLILIDKRLQTIHRRVTVGTFKNVFLRYKKIANRILSDFVIKYVSMQFRFLQCFIS